jgi:hypothetical protein
MAIGEKRGAMGVGDQEDLDCSGDEGTALTSLIWKIKRKTGN